jgi:hypothetical protein
MQVPTIPTLWGTATGRSSVMVSLVALGASLYYTAVLAAVHNSGPELYGVLAAATSTGAAAANVAILRSSRSRRIATVVVIAIWAVVALAGIAGTVAHVIGPVAGHGPVDLRHRPITAPLVFTVLGAAGAAALVLGQRGRTRAPGLTSEKE